MQAEAAEAQSLQDAETIEQMQAAISELYSPKIKALSTHSASDCTATAFPSGAKGSVQGMTSPSEDSRLDGHQQEDSREGMSKYQHSKAAPETVGLLAEVQALKQELLQVSKNVASLKAGRPDSTAEILDLKGRLAALNAEVAEAIKASKATVHVLQQDVAAHEAGRAVDIKRQAAVNMDVKGKVSKAHRIYTSDVSEHDLTHLIALSSTER